MPRISLAYEQRIRIGARKSAANVLAQNIRGVPAFVDAVSVHSELSRPLLAAGSIDQCNTARSLSAGVSKPKVFRGR